MNRITSSFVFLLAYGVVLPDGAFAQTPPLPAGNVHIQINPDQRLMLEAAQKVIAREYREAEALYSQAISMNGANIDAWLQRGMVRREMGNVPGTVSDGHMAISLADDALTTHPKNSMLYYQRGMGYRLLREYDLAKKDMRAALDFGGNPNWKIDLQAIQLEEKAGQ